MYSVRSNSALPDYGDYTETYWSYFNVNFNVNFKFFKKIQLCISWLNETLIVSRCAVYIWETTHIKINFRFQNKKKSISCRDVPITE
jgi:hypothetical protein